MGRETAMFEEFVIRRVDEVVKEDEEYQQCINKSIELFDTLQRLVGKTGEEIVFEYESVLSDINRITNKAIIDVCKNMCK